MSEPFEVYCLGCDFPRKMDYPYYYRRSECQNCGVVIPEDNFKKCLQCDKCGESLCETCEKKQREK